MHRVVNFLKDVTVIPLSEKSLEIYDTLRSDYKGKGRHDLLIASIVMEYKLKLVTNNVKDFDFIDGLEIENWAK